MKPIGGEIHIKKEDAYFYLTDSGRSSLRLILRSGVSNMKFLLPDFLCKVIIDVFDQEKVRYSFYKVKDDFSIDEKTLKNKDCDCLYLIDYFGKQHGIVEKIARDDLLVLEDAVFLPTFERPPYLKNWIGFNSFRKISPLADGSMIKSTLRLLDEQIIGKSSKFAEKKYCAKEIKYEYLYYGAHSCKQYLNIFKSAEEALERQRRIYSISNSSMRNLFNFLMNSDKEYATRRENVRILRDDLGAYEIPIKVNYNSFYILKFDMRDQLREYLFKHNVFLPVHWPKIKGIANDLYKKIISIPVDARFGRNDMKRITRLIKLFIRRSLP